LIKRAPTSPRRCSGRYFSAAVSRGDTRGSAACEWMLPQQHPPASLPAPSPPALPRFRRPAGVGGKQDAEGEKERERKTGRLSSPQGRGETMRASIGLLSALRRRDESTRSPSSSSFLHASGIYLARGIRRAGHTCHGRSLN